MALGQGGSGCFHAATDPDATQRPGHFDCESARIDLDRHFRRIRKFEAVMQKISQRDKFGRLDDGGSAAPEIYFLYPQRLRCNFCDPTDLVPQQSQIINDWLILRRDLGVAAAISAHRTAEGDVQIERSGFTVWNIGQPAGVNVSVDRGQKMWRAWIARVTW